MQNAPSKISSPFIGPLFALCSLLAGPASADTLVDIYELALENDALLKSRVAQYNADIELEKLALAPLLPQARAGYSSQRLSQSRDQPAGYD
jgi:outer membrane protein